MHSHLLHESAQAIPEVVVFAAASMASDLASITFGDVGSQEAQDNCISWRNGFLSDWELRCGERIFCVHRAIVARASSVLRASMDANYEKAGTDLADLLPAPVRAIIEDVLDEMYDGKSDMDDTHLVLAFTAADILGMRALFERTLKDITSKLSIHALSFLEDLNQLPLSDHGKTITIAAERTIAKNFDSFVKRSQSGGLLELSVDG